MKTIIATLSIFSVLTVVSLNCYGQESEGDTTTHVVRKDKMKLLTMPSDAAARSVAPGATQKAVPAAAPAQQPAPRTTPGGKKSGKGKKKN